MGDKIIEIQHQIRNNANSIRDFMDELSNWESEINQIDSQLASKTFPLLEPPPVRSSVATAESAGPSEPSTSQVVYKRDKNNMKDYYKAWDSFDVDQELDKLEDKHQIFQKPAKPAKAKSQIVIKGGRTVSSQVDRLKDAGNLEFSSGNYLKATQRYSECLDLDVPNDVKLVLLSNSSECWIRLRDFPRALESATEALKIDAKHVKSLLRSSKAKKALAMYKSARGDLLAALEVDAGNAALKQEMASLEAKVKGLNEELLAKMLTRGKVQVTGLKSIEVKEIGGAVVNESSKKKDDEKVLKEKTEKAIESVAIEKLPLPKNLVELERTWNMLTDVRKLSSYIESIPDDVLSPLFLNGNLESDFLMKVVNTLVSHFIDLQTQAGRFLAALASNKKFSVVCKFLTRKEKDRIRELHSLLGNPQIASLSGII